MPGARTLAVNLAVRGGAAWEDESRSGWSHLLEHLVFKGAGDMDAREIVERIEGQGGAINASTGYERTHFEVRGLEGTLPLAVQVLSDLTLRPRLDPLEIEREKDVVAQEIAEAFDTPDDHVFEMAQAASFDGQSMGRPILGRNETLKPVDQASMTAWRDHLYSPDRMVLAVSGAVEEEALLALAEQGFGAAAPGAAEAPSAARFTGGRARLTRRIEQANLVFHLPSCGQGDPADSATRMAAEILGGGMASRLFQNAREARGLAYAIDAWRTAYEATGVLGIYAGAAAERAEELAGVCAAEIRALAEQGPTVAELDRARAVLTAALWMSDENLAARAGRAASHTLAFGAPVPVETLAERLAAQTVGGLREAMAASLAPGLAATAVLGPKAAHGAGEAFARALFG